VLSQITIFLIDTVVTLFVYLLLARFHFQWLRCPSTTLPESSSSPPPGWLVMRCAASFRGWPGWTFRRCFLPGSSRSSASGRRSKLIGGEPRLVPIAAVALVDLVRFSVYILMAAVAGPGGAVVASHLFAFAPVLEALTRPFLRPLRRLIPAARPLRLVAAGAPGLSSVPCWPLIPALPQPAQGRRDS